MPRPSITSPTTHSVMLSVEIGSSLRGPGRGDGAVSMAIYQTVANFEVRR